ncbi:hypothetical protein [Kyrpidia sp.]|uniref:hypothetical protein n=1 Tax=Kyrpidia sp. TaxID=2073077 RepID=UPI0025899796|nr:hypothetical protein [Kyrpidia sp.]MCL6577710.1 hypothetical protein [Kyrpidia sp.]
MSLEDIVREAGEIFKEDGEKFFSAKLFLQQLLYTEDLEDKGAVVGHLRVPDDFDSLMQELQHAVEEMTRQNQRPPIQ